MIPIGEIPQLAACHRQRGKRECKVCASTIASGIGGLSTLETVYSGIVYSRDCLNGSKCTECKVSSASVSSVSLERLS